MLKKVNKNEEGDSTDDYNSPAHFQPFEGERNAFKFLSKMFSYKNKPHKFKTVRSPKPSRKACNHCDLSDQPSKSKDITPRHSVRGKVILQDEEITYQTDYEESETASRTHSQYDVLFIEGNLPMDGVGDGLVEDEIRIEKKRNKKPRKKGHRFINDENPYIEVVKVEDRGTETCDLVVPPPKPVVEDKAVEPCYPRECDLNSCEKERTKLKEDLKNKEKTLNSSMDEGSLLLDDLEKIKRHLSGYGNLPDIMNSCLQTKQENPTDFIYLSRRCLMELSKHLLLLHKQTEADIQKMKNELNILKKEKVDKDEKYLSIKKKLEVQTEKVTQESVDTAHLQTKMGKLQDTFENAKRLWKETERALKCKIENLESELAEEKHKSEKFKSALNEEKESNNKIVQNVDEKSYYINKLESEIKKLQNKLEASKQQIADINSSYKSKITKLELEHSNKMASICENQTVANEQLSKALDRSSNFVNQLQESKKENATLLEQNKTLQEKVGTLEREMIKTREQCTVAERKLTRQTQEVMALQSQVEKLESLKEDELLSVDGDIWCQIMYQHDQWILEDLRASLKDKENYLETLRSQGDCALRDFEKIQIDLQQRRQQFNELKDIFLDFEKQRDLVVREQRDFYNKMLLLSKKTIPRDRFFKNLIEECQSKSSKIELLESKLKETEQAIEETKKISEAQLKAMQGEMQFTAEKLYEFENQIKIKEMQLQEIINVFDQEKKNKVTAEEAMNTYKILLEDAKKENSELRNKVHYLEDLEKNRTNEPKTNEELAKETQKRHETERKLKKLEKEFVEMKNTLKCKRENDKDAMSTPHSEKSSVSSKEFEHLQAKVHELQVNKRYMERILMESQRSKEQMQKDQEELYNKLRHAVRVMVESKRHQEELERRLDQRTVTIRELQSSQDETEDRLEELKDILHEMKKTIELLYRDRDELQERLSNHMHCHAERAVHQELKLLQRDKEVLEEQNCREKEMLLQRIKDNENTIKGQHNHLRSLQEQVDSLNVQVREARASLNTERHSHTQQLLNVQSEKKKLELYIHELESRLTMEARGRLNRVSNTMVSSPNYGNYTSDSYDPPIRDINRFYPYRK